MRAPDRLVEDDRCRVVAAAIVDYEDLIVISELRQGHVRTWQLDPRSLGLPYARLSDLQVDTTDQAAEAMQGGS